MARTPKLDEGILGRMWGLLKTIHKRGKFYQAMERDPKLKKYTREFEKASKELASKVNDRRKNDPAFRKHYDKWASIYDWYIIGNKPNK